MDVLLNIDQLAVGWLSIELLYVVVFAAGAFAHLHALVSTSILPSIVKREDLTEGNSRLQLSTSTTRVAGPGAAGFADCVVVTWLPCRNRWMEDNTVDFSCPHDGGFYLLDVVVISRLT